MWVKRQQRWLIFLLAGIFLLVAASCRRPAPQGCSVGDMVEESIPEEGTDVLNTLPPIDTAIPARLETATFAMG